MKFVVDKNIPFVDSLLRRQAEIVLVESQGITPGAVKDADALLVRSVTPVNERLLEGSHVRFVGTATIGYDHVDVDYLHSQGIAFASAPGSNANSVAEYVVASLLALAAQLRFRLGELTLGVVGVGNVGSKVVQKAAALGMNVLRNDPPRARMSTNGEFVPLDEIMQADVVTLHVPLNMKGEDATYHLFDERHVNRMKPGAILINTSRGAVVETTALKGALRSRHLRGAVLDVWEGEPSIDTGLLSQVTIGTPHIAGYSTDGKANGARMVYEALCQHFTLPNEWCIDGKLPPPKCQVLRVDEKVGDLQEIVRDVVRQCYSIEHDDANLRELLALPPDRRAQHFKALRTQYPVRREFTASTVLVPSRRTELASCFAALGFSVATAQIHEHVGSL